MTKVLIADDEKHVREAIKMLADWNSHSVTEILEASDGQCAVDLIMEHSPQIVMTDMRMPRMDGTKLLEWIKANRPSVKTIVISGYDDFELVRHAIRSGGLDYILKPVDPDALHEALGKAVEAVRMERFQDNLSTRRNMELNRMKPHYADKLLTDLISSQGSKDDLVRQLREEFGLPENINTCSISVISTAQLDQELLEKFRPMRQLLYFTLINICNEVLLAGQKGIAFHHLENPEEIVLLIWDKTVRATLEEIRGGVDLALHRRIHFGLGSSQSFPSGAAASYHDAHLALWQRNLNELSGWLHTVTPPPHKPLRLSSNEENFRMAALSGSADRISAAVDDWLEQIRKLSSVTPAQLEQWNSEWDWMLNRWMDLDVEPASPEPDKDMLLELPRSLPLDVQGRLSYSLWKIQYEGQLAAASRILTQQHSRENHIIHDIADYLKNHYAEDISLQDMAARFFLSREYISRRFKQEFGVNISEFLADVRIEKAKLLLLNPQLRISQVAEMVGYQDEKYFSKVFKKLEGRTPNEYRKEQFSR
ncbi:response regulator [Paenibacillus sp.]|jgi:two-component system response regulator YesN|uniref:response regulator transcription factor n=1 Tax=Paenibacillus sp. TaxID=58172 RepID=UPI00281BBA6C|nr:response regulator [Paenibacillus sp.]MDR0269211.1 response regulator [Paenibacillus sp.]